MEHKKKLFTSFSNCVLIVPGDGDLAESAQCCVVLPVRSDPDADRAQVLR